MLSANILIRSPPAHVARRNELSISHPFRRTYVTQRPMLPKGIPNNKPLMIAGLVGIPAIAYMMIPPRAAPKHTRAPGETLAPNLDPAAEKRAHSEADRKYVHPEHENPDDYKPRFGEVHKHKRVDTPPDGRNHQSLSDRARVQ
ncbi:hypothetical protein GGR51DRAFT_562896 [Nemania sp. FL0031]|nr:hypothetical protein GGR51DRAFT_562896 [Nemania sp. FL0031]